MIYILHVLVKILSKIVANGTVLTQDNGEHRVNMSYNNNSISVCVAMVLE